MTTMRQMARLIDATAHRFVSLQVAGPRLGLGSVTERASARSTAARPRTPPRRREPRGRRGGDQRFVVLPAGHRRGIRPAPPPRGGPGGLKGSGTATPPAPAPAPPPPPASR